MQPAGLRAEAEQITVEVAVELFEPGNIKQHIPSTSESLQANHFDLRRKLIKVF